MQMKKEKKVARFEENKGKILENIDKKFKLLNNFKSCVTFANSREELKSFRKTNKKSMEEFRAAKKASKKENSFALQEKKKEKNAVLEKNKEVTQQ